MNAPRQVDVLLIGGGVASVRCARTLRRGGFDGSILIVGSEGSPPYNRPPLSKELLRDDLPDELVMAEAETWYARRQVDLHLGSEVMELDPDRGAATLDDGTRLAFTHCLIATGAQPRRLPAPGGEQAVLLRTLPDARRMRALAVEAASGASVTVIGGGFIGVEVASGLASLGLRPTIVEMAGQLWGGSLGDELDAWARDRLAGVGVDVRTGATITGLEEGVAWVGSERFDHAFAVAGVGVTPRTRLAEAAGLGVDDGIVVDGAQRTGHPSVWAAGDVARAGERRFEHWHGAREAGERAAKAMLGEALTPPRAPWLFSEVAGHQLDVVGFAPAFDGTEIIGDSSDRFAVAYLLESRIVQVAIVDAAIGVEEARAFVEGRPSANELDRLDRLREPAPG